MSALDAVLSTNVAHMRSKFFTVKFCFRHHNGPTYLLSVTLNFTYRCTVLYIGLQNAKKYAHVVSGNFAVLHMMKV